MDRLTSDKQESNFSALMNYARAENERVVLYCDDKAIDLCTYIEREAIADCGIDAESVMEGACFECGGCAMGVLCATATQAAELHGRLKQIEDILGDTYDLDGIREIVEAKKNGRLVVLPCKVGAQVYRIGASVCRWKEIDRCNDHCTGYEYEDCWEGEQTVLEEKFSRDMVGLIGKTVFLTREEAEAALKGGNENAL